MTDVIRKTYFYKGAQISEYGVKKPLSEATWYVTANALFEHAHDVCDRIASAHPLYEPATRMPELVQDSDAIIHHTFDAGEGVLIPGEIIHHANHGCEAFLILQPFGCLPNHIVGRGIVKRLRELYPAAQILSLDYDPDVSFANVENRLQMLVMNVRESHATDAEHVDIEEVSKTVDAVAQEAEQLAHRVLKGEHLHEHAADYTVEHVDAAAETMKAILELEDELAARAKDALTAARKAAQYGAGDAFDAVTERALAVSEMTREMRTRTRAALQMAADTANDLRESGDEALTYAQEELWLRIADAHDFAARVVEQAGNIVNKS